MFIIPSIDLSMKLSLSEVFVSNIIVTMVISNKSCCKHVLFTNLSDFISTTTRVTSLKSKKFLFCSFSVAKFGIAPFELDHNDGQFFRAMEWLMFFFRPPLPSMVFQWFWQSWTITIECFLGGPTIGTNGFSMVFKILRAMVNNGFEVNDGVPGQDHITKWW